MATFSISGKKVELPATLVEPIEKSRDESSWHLGKWLTVIIIEPVAALRVHTDGKHYPGRDASLSEGGWVLIGDVIQSSSAIASSRSLPSDDPSAFTAFTHVNEAIILATTKVNIGIAAPKWGGAGGGLQAEYVSGPAFRFKSLEGKMWHSKWGSA